MKTCGKKIQHDGTKPFWGPKFEKNKKVKEQSHFRHYVNPQGGLTYFCKIVTEQSHLT